MILQVLIVDDDPDIRSTLEAVIEKDGHSAVSAETPGEATALVDRGVFDLAFVDMRLGDESGLDLIPTLLSSSPWIKIVLITAHGTVESAVDAIRKGAFDYITKPFTPTHVRVIAERVSRLRSLERRVEALEEDRERLVPAPNLSSRNPAMKRALEMAERVAASDATILLRGESGTGKGVVAEAIHRWSKRRERAFSTVNCPSLAPELLQSELFGHVKGAFTGAVSTKAGRIEITEGGSLFLDEVGDLPAEIQPRLLRFLQTREYERVGDPQTRRSDVRILAATNRDLGDAVANGSFREDLYYRLNVITITIPPLRERPEDIIDYAESFLLFFAARYDRPNMRFSPAAAESIRNSEWPGNVRELQNAVERAVILAVGEEVGPELFGGGDAPASNGSLPGIGSDLVTLEEMESRYIKHVLQRTASIEEAAETLGVAPSTLWRRRRKYDI
ncbi:MAG: sigma-54-dependent Fis family transcriptional regulator [Gemmatimonadetes bacterium]|nr:sigma-54-dependent Fis family transcriptional regulator [Gemmatimonadota bacterium]NNM32371.1 sigma-54-dependent Fis family transcriptional regulator [Gemmatimonadota bacterium]